MMNENRLRRILQEGKTSVSTRIWSTWPVITESLAALQNFDYMEFVAEYAPFSQADLENICRAAELYGMGSMIKVDLQNRAYVAQKAVASGFQAVNFADHYTAEQVEESVRMMHPFIEGTGGLYGCPKRRFISNPNGVSQMDHAARLNDIVLCFMIEKASAVENVEEICAVPGVDMVQFGPSDYCMSLGWNRKGHEAEFKAAERRMIEAALKHGVQPRCEINSPEEAQYYIDLGVKHFSLGDQMAILTKYWSEQGGKMKVIAQELETI